MEMRHLQCMVAGVMILTASVQDANAGRRYGQFEVLDDDRAAYYSGEIGGTDKYDLARMIRDNPGVGVVALNSPGGSVMVGLDMAETIRESGLSTYIASRSTCASACSFAFLAGVRRDVAGRLGVHQFSGPEMGQGSTQTLSAAIVDTLTGFGTWGHVLATMLATPADDMHFFTQDELARHQIETDPLDRGLVAAIEAAVSKRPSSVGSLEASYEQPRTPSASAGGLSIALYGGLDLYGGDIASKRVDDLGGCAAECMILDQCKGFTFNSDERIRRGPNCFLKNDFEAMDGAGVAISGLFVLPGETAPSLPTLSALPEARDLIENLAYLGKPLRPSFHSRSAWECRVACMKDDECQAFSYWAEGDICAPIRKVTSTVASEGAKSGRRGDVAIHGPKVIALGE